MRSNKKWKLVEAQIAILVAALLQLLIDKRLSLGSKYLIICLEIVLAIGIGIMHLSRIGLAKKSVNFYLLY